MAIVVTKMNKSMFKGCSTKKNLPYFEHICGSNV